MSKIAICISTRNRPSEYRKCFEAISEYAPPNSNIITVDDASEEDYSYASYRFKDRAGIPAVKNKCLELAMQIGAEQIFLFDDDCWPTHKSWFKEYISSPHPHLCFSFLTPGWEQGGHVHHRLGNGCMMYFTRECIELVGGFRTDYGLGAYEHSDISHRIFAAGLIPHPFIDIMGSDRLLHSMDQHGEVTRSFTDQEKADLLQRNYPIFAQLRYNTNFVPYESR